MVKEDCCPKYEAWSKTTYNGGKSKQRPRRKHVNKDSIALKCLPEIVWRKKQTVINSRTYDGVCNILNCLKWRTSTESYLKWSRWVFQHACQCGAQANQYKVITLRLQTQIFFNTLTQLRNTTVCVSSLPKHSLWVSLFIRSCVLRLLRVYHYCVQTFLKRHLTAQKPVMCRDCFRFPKGQSVAISLTWKYINGLSTTPILMGHKIVTKTIRNGKLPGSPISWNSKCGLRQFLYSWDRRDAIAKTGRTWE